MLLFRFERLSINISKLESRGHKSGYGQTEPSSKEKQARRETDNANMFGRDFA